MSYFPYLGTELARLRKKNGLSPQALAQQLGLREVTILNLEDGKFFKPDVVEQILTFFKCRLAVKPIENSKVQIVTGK